MQILLEDKLDRTLEQIPEESREIVMKATEGMTTVEAIRFVQAQAKVEKTKAAKAQKPAQLPTGSGGKEPYPDITDWAKKNKLYT